MYIFCNSERQIREVHAVMRRGFFRRQLLSLARPDQGSKCMNQNYGVLRVVRVLPSTRSTTGATNAHGRYPAGWLPEEGLVHVLAHQETNIGRALNNDVILLDLTVSREHASLHLDQT